MAGAALLDVLLPRVLPLLLLLLLLRLLLLVMCGAWASAALLSVRIALASSALWLPLAWRLPLLLPLLLAPLAAGPAGIVGLPRRAWRSALRASSSRACMRACKCMQTFVHMSVYMHVHMYVCVSWVKPDDMGCKLPLKNQGQPELALRGALPSTARIAQQAKQCPR